jgi:hypothetical protein
LDETGQQPDLTDQPEILAARRSYQRLARAHGQEAARSAYLKARDVMREWRDEGPYPYFETPGFNRRITRFLGPEWRVGRDSPLSEAARYPQVVALTRLLVSPYWICLAVSDHVMAGRPDKAGRAVASGQIVEFRSKAYFSTGRLADPDIPKDMLARLAATYLLEDGPNLRVFVGEVQRTVEPSYQWRPYPRGAWRSGREDGPYDPLVEWVQECIEAGWPP